jgi:hypothetical protein
MSDRKFKRVFVSDKGEKKVVEMTYREWADAIVSIDNRFGWFVMFDGVPFKYDTKESDRLERNGVLHVFGTWPMTSYALGVSSEEVPEMKQFDALHGVPTEYTPDGDPIFTSKSHRAAYCRAHGYFDRNAGYRDPAPLRR